MENYYIQRTLSLIDSAENIQEGDSVTIELNDGSRFLGVDVYYIGEEGMDISSRVDDVEEDVEYKDIKSIKLEYKGE